jgi:hypothetical protein
MAFLSRSAGFASFHPRLHVFYIRHWLGTISRQWYDNAVGHCHEDDDVIQAPTSLGHASKQRLTLSNSNLVAIPKSRHLESVATLNGLESTTMSS